MSRAQRSILRALQSELEALYGIDTHLDVDAYSIDDATRTLFPEAIDGLVEQLFVRDAQDSLEMALYVAPRLLRQLEADQINTQLQPRSIDAFCIAVEGVSHFVFLAWRATVERPVTALEMELQAEVDKFVICWLRILEGRAHPAVTADSLLMQLFKRYSLRPALPEDEHERYIVASRAAHNVCRRLVRDAGQMPQIPAIIHAARQFFRRGLPEKLRAA